ncbi:MAG TPA: class I SAM-dependent methyltransferase [Terriglobales bacterium]|nr:class I SAM-dependent methyltransferase [Terriglobales bacterium]
MIKRTWIERVCFPEYDFGGYTRRDGTVAFYSRVHSLLRPDSVVLDIGCGRGEYADDSIALRRHLRILKPHCSRVIGLDPDPDAERNPFIHAFFLLRGDTWPVPDASIDLCLADWVLEHVAEPDRFFAECARVLKPDGVLAARTTNAASPLGLASRIVPNRMHAGLLRKLGSGRKEADVFATLHRCNRGAALRRLLKKHQFVATVQHHEAEPVYLRRSTWSYLLEFLYLRLAPARWQYTIFLFARKRETTAPTTDR